MPIRSPLAELQDRAHSWLTEGCADGKMRMALRGPEGQTLHVLQSEPAPLTSGRSRGKTGKLCMETSLWVWATLSTLLGRRHHRPTVAQAGYLHPQSRQKRPCSLKTIEGD